MRRFVSMLTGENCSRNLLLCDESNSRVQIVLFKQDPGLLP